LFIINRKKDILESLITIFILIAVFCIYYTFAKNKFRKYGNSPVNKKIDLIYSKWYRKSAYLLNRNNTTIYEIDKLLFSLKKELMNVGISKDDIKLYIEMLKSYKENAQFGVKDILIGILTFVTTNSLVTDYVKKNQDNIFERINRYLSNQENVNQVINAFIIFLAIVIAFAFIWVIIKATTLDTIHKKSQRLFVLNGLLNIWDYKENQDIEKISDITQPETKTVYVNLKFGKSKTDEFIDTSLGEDYKKYFYAIYDVLVTILDNLNDMGKSILRFIFAILIPSIMGIISLGINFLLIYIWRSNSSDITFATKVITSVFLLLCIVVIFMVYFGMFKSTFEKYKSIPDTSKKNRKFSKTNLIQLCLTLAIYGCLGYSLFHIHWIFLFSLVTPVGTVILSILWSPKINNTEDK
jgi:membrane protein